MIDFKNNLANSVHFVLISILTIIIPSGFYNLEGVFIALLFVNWLFLVRGFKALKKISVQTGLLFGFFILFVIGLAYTNNVPLQIKHIEHNLSYLLIPLSFVGFQFTDRMKSFIKKGFIFSIIISVLYANSYAIIDYLITKEKDIFLPPSIYNKFTYYGLTRVFKDWHPTYVSLFLNVSLIFSFNEYFQKKKYIIWVLLSVFATINIFLLNSFIGIIAFLFIFYLFVFYLLSKNKKLLISSTILIVLLGVFLFKENPFKYSKIEKLKNTEIKITDKKDERNTLNLRLAKWKTSLDVFMNVPILGTSNGDIKNTLHAQYVKNDFLYCAEQRYSSHNQFLYTLSANGILGLTILVLIIFFPLFKIGSSNTFKMFLAVCSVFFLTEDLLARQQGLVFFVFFYMLLSHPLQIISINESKK